MFDPTRLAEIAAGPVPAALCTVVGTHGSTPRKLGASMVVIADGTAFGRIEGTIGGGAIEHEVRRAALDTIAATRPRRLDVSLTAELGMCCGGTMSVLIEPLRQRPPCILLGAGHVAQATAAAAHLAGFQVHVADPREELRLPARFSVPVRLYPDYAPDDLAELPFGPDAFVVVATHDHQVDQALVEQVLPREFRYLALIASRRKAAMTRKRCLARGIDPLRLGRLRAPAGLDIGAETPEEIALSLVAEMVAVRRGAALVAPGDPAEADAHDPAACG